MSSLLSSFTSLNGPLCIVGYGTGVTETRQSVAKAEERFGGAYRSIEEEDHSSDIDFIFRLMSRAGIENRFVCQRMLDLEKEWNYQVPYYHKMKCWYEYACEMSYKSVNESLNDYVNNYGGSPKDITHVICHSVTGWLNPGMTHFLVNKFGLSTAVRPIEANIAGCHGGTHLLYLATSIVRQKPNSVVLICDTEVMDAAVNYSGINYKSSDGSRSDQVALAIFGSGSSSLIVKNVSALSLLTGRVSNAPLWRVLERNQASYIVPNSHDDVTFEWFYSGKGKEESNITSTVCVLRPELSVKFNKFVYENLGDVLAGMYGENGFTLDKVEVAMHCGGKKLLHTLKTYLTKTFGSTASENALKNLLKYSFEIYREHGNQSGASILFSLKNACKNTQKDEMFFMSMGSGVTVQWGNLQRINTSNKVAILTQLLSDNPQFAAFLLVLVLLLVVVLLLL